MVDKILNPNVCRNKQYCLWKLQHHVGIAQEILNLQDMQSEVEYGND